MIVGIVRTSDDDLRRFIRKIFDRVEYFFFGFRLIFGVDCGDAFVSAENIGDVSGLDVSVDVCAVFVDVVDSGDVFVGSENSGVVAGVDVCADVTVANVCAVVICVVAIGDVTDVVVGGDLCSPNRLRKSNKAISLA